MTKRILQHIHLKHISNIIATNQKYAFDYRKACICRFPFVIPPRNGKHCIVKEDSTTALS